MDQDSRLGRAGRSATGAIRRLRFLHRVVPRIHRALYRASGGRVGASINGAAMLLLTTTGRRSGQPREVPLLTFQDDGDWIVVGSNYGKPNDPAWVLNVREDPSVRVQVGDEHFDATAEVVEGDEHERLWARALEVNDQFQAYADRSDRAIRVVRLRPS